MIIKRIKVKNFKSFNKLTVELSNFNVIIGSNASGKSNFLQIFRFIKDITKNGLVNAISLQGGSNYLKNISNKSDNKVFIEIEGDLPYGEIIKINRTDKTTKKILEAYAFETYNYKYSFAIEFINETEKFNVANEKFTAKLKLVRINEKSKNNNTKNFSEKLASIGHIEFIRRDNKLETNLVFDKSFTKEYDSFKELIEQRINLPKNLTLERRLSDTGLLLEGQLPYMMIVVLSNLLKEITIYDFDPKLPKKAIPFTGRIELEEDGNNLAIVLNNLLNDNDKKRMFANLIKEVLPFIEDFKVERFSDKYLISKFKENYIKEHYFPASLMSDGTINITALIIAIYFEKKSFIAIEEPNRNIHPYLVSKLTEMIKESSIKKQIIITTHNPEVLRNINLQDLILISRDEHGFSIAKKPIEIDEVKSFLEDEIGIEDLFIDNLLT